MKSKIPEEFYWIYDLNTFGKIKKDMDINFLYDINNILLYLPLIYYII
jgi:hypothetical protein